jgi:hypothetical protein
MNGRQPRPLDNERLPVALYVETLPTALRSHAADGPATHKKTRQLRIPQLQDWGYEWHSEITKRRDTTFS